MFEYDTLTSEERWDETFDVVIANPPFMSPKGGIRPHKRFSMQSARSEVLFVDYIAEHLNKNGRAGVIVPEGIIFQSGTAYKALRKTLVEKYLYAVVSLPAGVFQPYSGVKTSILLMDKQLAKRADSILFIKVENDGFDLGAQRRVIEKNDLTQALLILQEYKQALQENTDSHEVSGLEENSRMALVVDKAKIAKNGDYNLSGERYRESVITLNQEWPMVELGDVCETTSGGTPLKSRNEYYDNGTIPWLKSGEVAQGFIYESNEKITLAGLNNSSAKIFPVNTVLVAMYGATAGQVGLLKFEAATNQAICGILPNNKFVPEFLYWILKSQRKYLVALSGGGAQPNISQNIIRKLTIPLPPLEIQTEIVAELEEYQKIIGGAKQVVENYKSQVKISPNWSIVELGTIVLFKRGPFGGSLKKEIFTKDGYKVYEQKHAIKNNFEIGEYYVDEKKYQEMIDFAIKPNDLIISCSGTMGKIAVVPANAKQGIINQALLKLTPIDTKVIPMFLKLVLEDENIQKKYFRDTSGAAIQNVSSVPVLKGIQIPLPSLDVQKEIVAQIEEEQKRVQATKELGEIFEQKIKDIISEVWGENTPSSTDDTTSTRVGVAP